MRYANTSSGTHWQHFSILTTSISISYKTFLLFYDEALTGAYLKATPW